MRVRSLFSHSEGRVTCEAGNRDEVTRARESLKWLGRFRFKLKFEFEAGLNRDQDR